MRASHAACSAALSGALVLAMVGTAASVPARHAPAAPPAFVATAFTWPAVATTPAAPPAVAARAAVTHAAAPRR